MNIGCRLARADPQPAGCKRACMSFAGCTSLSYEAAANNCQLAAYNSKANATLLSGASLLGGPGSTAMVTDVVSVW